MFDMKPNPGLEDMFAGRFVRVSGGAITIDLLTAEVKYVATMTMENAAKLASSYLYAAFESPKEFKGDPMWTNSLSFCDETTAGEPAVTVIDDQLFVNDKTFQGDLAFWKLFTKYWALNVLKGMKKALEGREQTLKERTLINHFETIKGDLPLSDL